MDERDVMRAYLRTDSRGWYAWLQIGNGRALIVHSRRGHVVRFSEREGHQRWRYLGPICWTVRR